MRLVQIHLRPSIPFWFVDDIVKLNPDNPTSDYIDADALSDENQNVINMSIRRMEVNAFDCNGVRIRSLDDVVYAYGEMAVSVEDVADQEEELLPEIVSVTVSEHPKEEQEEIISLEPSEEHLENAKILLEQNGNTIKKMIRNMAESEESLMLLYALRQVEINTKTRTGVVRAIEDAIERY